MCVLYIGVSILMDAKFYLWNTTGPPFWNGGPRTRRSSHRHCRSPRPSPRGGAKSVLGVPGRLPKKANKDY